MDATSPQFLTPDEAAALARCSIKTVRRAYGSGALVAYRRRGSRAVVLDPQDVLEWARGELLQPKARPPDPAEHSASEQRRRKTIKPGDSRSPKLGNQQRFDVSAKALRERGRGRASTAPHT